MGMRRDTGTAEGKVKTGKVKTEVVISFSALVVSIISIALSLYIQSHSVKADQFAKAKAGNTEAQLFLANHYYEIGDYEESLYWNKIASVSTNKYGAYAKNNLAVLYLQNKVGGSVDHSIYVGSSNEAYTFDVKDDNVIVQQKKIFKLFKDAYLAGVEEAGINLYAYLLQSPYVYFIGIDYKSEKEWICEQLKAKGKWEDLEEQKRSKYVFAGRERANGVLWDDDEHIYVTTDADYRLKYDTASGAWYMDYLVFEKTEDSEYVYRYAYPE